MGNHIINPVITPSGASGTVTGVLAAGLVGPDYHLSPVWSPVTMQLGAGTSLLSCLRFIYMSQARAELLICMACRARSEACTVQPLHCTSSCDEAVSYLFARQPSRGTSCHPISLATSLSCQGPLECFHPRRFSLIFIVPVRKRSAVA
jgi:hypothetical protein